MPMLSAIQPSLRRATDAASRASAQAIQMNEFLGQLSAPHEVDHP
jgi:hypothetical protein